MAQFVSSLSKGVDLLPEDYVLPIERRPSDIVTFSKEIPVINLQTERSEIVQQIVKALEEFGIFQVINHGISDKMMEDIRDLYNEFYNMLAEDELGNNHSENYGKGCKLFTGSMTHVEEGIHYWKDTLVHECHPLEEHVPSWPVKPARYRDEVGKYALQMRKLALTIMDLIGEGLGLNKGYFNETCQRQTVGINHYPPCPDPSLALGICNHVDSNLITLLQQDQFGLQAEKDGKWLGIEPIPNALVVNAGYLLEVISNGKLKGVEHRVVLNSTVGRTSIAMFFAPHVNHSVVIEPAKGLITTSSPQMFRSFQANEFLENYLTHKPGSSNGTLLDHYRL